MSNYKAELVGLNWYGAIAAYDEAGNSFILLDLYVFLTIFKKTWNRILTCLYLVTFSVILFVNIPDKQNHVSESSQVKEKNLWLC